MKCQWVWKSWRRTPEGKTLVLEWKDEVDKFVWTEFRATLEFLDGQPPENWRRPFTQTLHGGKKTGKKGCSGLLEIIFDVNNVEYRPLGYYSGEREFTILFFAKEIGDEFVPKNACDIAKKRKAEIEADKEKARVFWFEKRNS